MEYQTSSQRIWEAFRKSFALFCFLEVVLPGDLVSSSIQYSSFQLRFQHEDAFSLPMFLSRHLTLNHLMSLFADT